MLPFMNVVVVFLKCLVNSSSKIQFLPNYIICIRSSIGRKGNKYGVDIVETEKRMVETVVMEVPAGENDGKCKCGANCSCTNCTCGH
ncbi:metallothionein-like protein type 3 [Arachis ipaensis]|uniref:metallothionein-like protein type 3 n=1 Tax=Arachis ipaensis TaxID=130454 RepID=UPI000A2B4D82|nr:metallothionein-like protein type 3 [Arachis ipaensis]